MKKHKWRIPPDGFNFISADSGGIYVAVYLPKCLTILISFVGLRLGRLGTVGLLGPFSTKKIKMRVYGLENSKKKKKIGRNHIANSYNMRCHIAQPWPEMFCLNTVWLRTLIHLKLGPVQRPVEVMPLNTKNTTSVVVFILFWFTWWRVGYMTVQIETGELWTEEKETVTWLVRTGKSTGVTNNTNNGFVSFGSAMKPECTILRYILRCFD